MKKHLEDLGFVVGDTITVVTTLNGNVIVKGQRGARGNKRRNGAQDHGLIN